MGLKVLIAVVIGLLFIVFLFARPKTGISLVLIGRPILDSMTFLQTTYIAGSINVLQAIGMVLPFALVLVCIFKAPGIFKHKEANIYLIFVFLCLPSVFFSRSILEAGADWMKLFTLWAVLVFLLSFIKTRKDIHTLFIVILIASIYPLLRFAIGFVLNQTTYINGFNRYTGGYFHMGPISFMLMLFMPTYLYLFEQSKSLIIKFFCLTIMAFIPVCIFFAYYRSALVGIASLILSYLVFRKKYIPLIFALMLIPIAMLTSDFLIARFHPLFEMLFNFKYLFDPSNEQYDQLLSGRFGIWRRIVTMYLYAAEPHNLIFGFGYKVAVGSYLIAPHNDYLSFFFQSGFLSMIAFFIFFFIAIRNGFIANKSPHSAILLCILISSLITAMTTNYFVSVRVGLYVGTYIAMLKKLKLFEREDAAMAT